MKKQVLTSFLLAALALLTTQTADAQSSQGKTYLIRTGVNLLGGRVQHFNSQAESYERFRSAYNTYYKSRVRTPLGDLGATNGYFYGLDVHIAFFYMSFVQYRLQGSSAMSELPNGDRREFRLDLQPLELNADLIFPVGGRLEMGMALGFQQQKGAFYSGYRYANGGPLSYAEDQALNGIYRLKASQTINLGIRADIKLLKIQKEKSLLTLSLRAERIGVFTSYLQGKSELLPWRDEMIGQATNGAINADGFQFLYQAEDPANQFRSSVRYGLNGQNLNGNFTGWRVCASLILTPYEWILR